MLTAKTTTTKKASTKKAAAPKAKASAKKAAPKAVVIKSKKDVISEFKTHGKDTGSAQVQVAILTNRIAQLAEHLKDHPKDKHSRRGLVGMVGDRRKMLRYLQIHQPETHGTVIKSLGLRK